jgi:hypothetical protein
MATKLKIEKRGDEILFSGFRGEDLNVDFLSKYA